MTDLGCAASGCKPWPWRKVAFRLADRGSSRGVLYKVSALYPVIGGAGKNCGGAVNLFAEHRPRQ